ncbi:Calmodulin-like protein 5 [Mortierella antarctica]|nr:Calmodulin-like protein 5 [Mortierella alpina]KAF9981511.1 Calmodulin-like protein 5 [Mortierella antarctica]
MASTQAQLLFTPDELKNLEDLFDRNDANTDGRINAKELLQLILSTGQTAPSKDLETTIASFDTDGDGELDFKEFMSIMTHLKAL